MGFSNKIDQFLKSKLTWIKASKKRKISLVILLILGILYYFSLPKTLFKDPLSTVVFSENNELLGAKIATDGQWRFPKTDSIPYKFEQCILNFEDQYFDYHFGFNPISMGKAFLANIKAKKVVRGGSTITQQVIRLSRKNQKRSYFEKLIELILCTRLELKFSKKEILKFYASYAPYGGNVVGIDMASWRYFGVPASELSWAESATLSVLPNAPSLIYPGKNQKLLLTKRNRLLKKIFDKKIIDSITYSLSITEKLPQKPFSLPQKAPHLVERLTKTNRGQKIKTTINTNLQKQTNQIVNKHFKTLSQNNVFNIGVLIIDVETRAVKTYIGNTPTTKKHQKDVDVITAPRSTGSILKPLLYASLFDKGELLPHQLVTDVPTVIAGYQPENFNETYQGTISADKALTQSLNIPAVRLLKQYGLHRFHQELKAYKLKDIKFGADHYGLSLILGGAESNLWDLCKTYSGLAGTLSHFEQTNGKYFSDEFLEPKIISQQKINFGKSSFQQNTLGAGSIWNTFEALTNLNRPQSDKAWEYFESSKKIAWKTGTSFGNRDAWAIGCNKKYVVGVWVGNADGEGRAELTGINSAAPILLDIFNLFTENSWFSTPFNDLIELKTCQKSGMLASNNCEVTNTIFVSPKAENSTICTYHKTVHLTQNEQFQVNSSCYNVDLIKTKSWFILPAIEAFYYKRNHPDYSALPPFHKNCNASNKNQIDFIFPKPNTKIHLTKNFDGSVNEFIVKVAHSRSNSTIHWHINNQYITTTNQFHEIPIQPSIGKHLITAIDEIGNSISRTIEFL